MIRNGFDASGMLRRVRAGLYLARRLILAPEQRRVLAQPSALGGGEVGGPAALPAEQGHVDHLRDGVLVGWARDLDEPRSRPSVDVYLDRDFIGRASCDLLREDLREAGMGDGRYGFCFRLPDAVLAIGGELRVFAARSGLELLGGGFWTGEVRTEAASDADRQAVRRVVERLGVEGGAVTLRRQQVAYGRRLAALSQAHPDWVDAGFPVTRVMAYVNARLHESSKPTHGERAYFELLTMSAAHFRDAIAGLPMSQAQVDALARPTGWLLAHAVRVTPILDAWMYRSRTPPPQTEGQAAVLLCDFLLDVLVAYRLPLELLGEAAAFLGAPAEPGGRSRLERALGGHPVVQLAGEEGLSPQRTRLLIDSLGLVPLLGEAGVEPALKREPSSPAVQPGVRVVAAGYTAGGLTLNARHSAQILKRLGVPFRVSNHPPTAPGPLDLGEPSYETVLLHMQPDDAVEMLTRIPASDLDASRVIGFFLWETETLPEAHDLGARLVDEIWTASQFSQGVYQRACPDTTCANVGHLVTEPELSLGFDVKRWAGAAADATLFYFHFDAHSWITRKNPVAAVRAFRLAFSPHERVALLIKTRGASAADDPKWAQWWRELHEEAAQDPRIRLRDDDVDAVVMASLEAGCDAFVSLHRAEGFGYGVAQAMLQARPVIVTAYSGSMDFTGEDEAFLVPAVRRRLRRHEFLYADAGQVWGEPDVAAAAAQMRRVVDDPAEAARRGAKARARILAQCSLDALAKTYAAALARTTLASPLEHDSRKWTPVSATIML